MTPIYQVTATDLRDLVTKAVAAGIAEFEAKSKPFLSVADMAARYGCSRDTIYTREAAGKLPHREESGKWSRAELERWEQDRA